jgi:hypothetical protein
VVFTDKRPKEIVGYANPEQAGSLPEVRKRDPAGQGVLVLSGENLLQAREQFLAPGCVAPFFLYFFLPAGLLPLEGTL